MPARTHVLDFRVEFFFREPGTRGDFRLRVIREAIVLKRDESRDDTRWRRRGRFDFGCEWHFVN